ncbi:MAG: Coenzyme F420 hydrogenase/dehydrogenase, beta subunit C-terminal domain [Clostridiales bacterium]|nr:Coenzyme F420 hydrogenase/dehydrogenase, beta subunit C-terminal domain [Clostridiales bacterium]
MIVEFNDREPLVVNARRNNYFRAFSKDIILRPSCADCNYLWKHRVGDLTIGDFWEIQELNPEMFDDKGASVLLLNTEKGSEIWSKIENGFQVKEKTLSEGFKYNHRRPIRLKPERDEFFRRFREEPINERLYDYNDIINKIKEE